MPIMTCRSPGLPVPPWLSPSALLSLYPISCYLRFLLCISLQATIVDNEVTVFSDAMLIAFAVGVSVSLFVVFSAFIVLLMDFRVLVSE
jgi:hypothetical protein